MECAPADEKERVRGAQSEGASAGADAMEAAFALSCLGHAGKAPPAHALAQLPGTTDSYPFMEGKGCFTKRRTARAS